MSARTTIRPDRLASAVRRAAASLVFGLAAGGLGACDSGDGPDAILNPCEVEDRIGDLALSYFPLEDGARLEFSYSASESSFGTPYRSQTSGDLIWDVSQSTCNTFMIREAFSGERVVLAGPDTTSVEEVDWVKSTSVHVEGRLLSVTGYRGLEEVAWWRGSEADVTVRVDTVYGCGFGGCVQSSYTLTRGHGLESWAFSSNQRSRSSTSIRRKGPVPGRR